MAWIWDEFLLLSRRRQVGMEVNPLLDTELEAFCRRRLLPLSAWQKDLMFRLDDAALAAFRGDRRDAKAAQEAAKAERAAEPNLIPVTNKAGIFALFKGLAAKKAALAKSP